MKSPESPSESKTTSLNAWERTPPQLYNIVTGFFPEASPKDTWETNPRPLLVCGVAQDEDSGQFFCRIAYGTSNLDWAQPDDLVVANLSILDGLNLKYPTRFVIYSGDAMVILPWSCEFFKPWRGFKSPFLSTLPENMQRYVAYTLCGLDNLPKF